MFINSTPEKCNLSLLPKGGRGSVKERVMLRNFYVPISLVPFKLGRGGGFIENVPMSPSEQFIFLKASLMN